MPVTGEGPAGGDPLAPRLFGYGLLYRVRLRADGVVEPLAAEAGAEARALAAALALLAGTGEPGDGGDPGDAVADLWAASVPFGRCGLSGRPREHIRVHGALEAHHDTLGPEGYGTRSTAAGETLVFEPGFLHRLRARPRGAGRVLVAFQTEDRTPLNGHAAPVSRGGAAAAAAHPERLAGAWRAFEDLRLLAGTDLEAYRRELAGFMDSMAAAVAGDPEMARIQAAAAAAGTYDLADQDPLFARQAALLRADVIGRIGRQDPELFRFPGMFGAVAPLFPLLTP